MATIEPGLGRAQARGFWWFGSKPIVRGVFFGIVMALFVGIGDRADAALTGGAFPILGGLSWATIMGISTLLCRQPGGIIAGVIQGIVDIALGLSPLALIFPVVNTAGSLAYSLIAWRLPMTGWHHHLLAQIAGNVVGDALVAIGLYFILALPVEVILVSVGVTMIVSTVGGTALTKILVDKIGKSGVLD
ncbi:MAG: hypothetical protein ACYC3S_06385 [Chloroflexota bacterium]